MEPRQTHAQIDAQINAQLRARNHQVANRARETPQAEPVEVESEEVARHLKRWHVFAHLTKWFAIHAAVGLVGIFFLLMDNMPLGAFFLAAGAAVLVYGVATVPRAAPRADVTE